MFFSLKVDFHCRVIFMCEGTKIFTRVNKIEAMYEKVTRKREIWASAFANYATVEMVDFHRRVFGYAR